MSRRSGTTGTPERGYVRFFRIFAGALSLLITAAVTYTFFIPYTKDSIYFYTLLLTVVLIGGGLLCRKARPFLERKSHLFLVTVLFLLCAAVKLIWVLRYRIEPMVDYATFYETARQLAASQPLKNELYIALFPHIFGYSYFLSFFFRLFGDGTMVPPIINAALSCISMLLLYDLCSRLFSKSAGVAASLIWIAYPSQTIYNMFALSEPLYTALILAFFSLFVMLEKRGAFTKSYLWAAGASAISAILLVSIHLVRPISMILLISAAIVLIFMQSGGRSGGKALQYKLAYIALALVFSTGLSMLATRFLTQKIGELPAAMPGYSLYVGFNESAGGKYNQEDADLLFRYAKRPGWSATDAQQAMLQEWKTRAQSGIRYGGLIRSKFETLWAEDTAALYYMRSIVSDPNDRDFLRIICNAFYHFTILLSSIAVFFMLKRRERPALFLFPLFLIGLTLAQMLVEVAGRYHYSGILVFTVLSAYVLTLPSSSTKAGQK